MALIRDRILAALKDNPGTGVAVLAEVLSLEPDTVSGNMSKLFTDNLVSRTGKRGKYLYTLTAKGRADIKKRQKLQGVNPLCSPRRKDNPVILECRVRWQGYRIHKIFGSAGR